MTAGHVVGRGADRGSATNRAPGPGCGGGAPHVSGFARALSIRPGEGRLLGFVAAAFAAVEAGRGLGEVGVDTLILNRSGASALPPLYVGLGLVGLVVTLGYGALLARAGGDRFVPWLLLSFALLLGAERLLALTSLEAVYPALWISVYVVGALLVTVLWTVAGAAFHARQAKRLFPLCTGAAIAGSFVGLLAAGPVARLVGAENLVLAEALLIAVAAALLSRVRIRLRPAARPGEARPSMAATLGAGAAYVARSPLMRLIAIAYLLFAVLLFSVSYPFLGAMSAAFPTQAGLATALGVFSATVTAVSFLIAVALANRVTARVGVASVALLLPVVYLAGFGAWLVRFTLATAVGVRFAQQVTQRGLSNAAWSSFFSVLPPARRGQVLAFIDGVPGQLGTVLSGLLLMAATLLPSEAVFALGAVTAAVCIVVVARIRRSYGLSLIATLREGLGERVLEGGPGLAGLGRDPRVVAELRAATRAAHAGDRMFAAQLLGELRVSEAIEDLARLVADGDRQVRLTAVEALAAVGTETRRARLGRAGPRRRGRRGAPRCPGRHHGQRRSPGCPRRRPRAAPPSTPARASVARWRWPSRARVTCRRRWASSPSCWRPRPRRIAPPVCWPSRGYPSPANLPIPGRSWPIPAQTSEPPPSRPWLRRPRPARHVTRRSTTWCAPSMTMRWPSASRPPAPSPPTPKVVAASSASSRQGPRKPRPRPSARSTGTPMRYATHW